MSKFNAVIPVLFGGIAATGLAGCEQIEQAANDAVEKAKQSAAQVIDEGAQSAVQLLGAARQSDAASRTEDADQDPRPTPQSAERVIDEVKQRAAGLLGQASEYLATGQREMNSGLQPGKDSTSDL